VLLPGVLATVALIAVDQILGSAAFGAAAIIAAVVANAGQSITRKYSHNAPVAGRRRAATDRRPPSKDPPPDPTPSKALH
jgi:hypothetical protein